jgi:hypothetical protein
MEAFAEEVMKSWRAAGGECCDPVPIAFPGRWAGSD